MYKNSKLNVLSRFGFGFGCVFVFDIEWGFFFYRFAHFESHWNVSAANVQQMALTASPSVGYLPNQWWALFCAQHRTFSCWAVWGERKAFFGAEHQLVRVMAAAVSWRLVQTTTINILYVVSLLFQHCVQPCVLPGIFLRLSCKWNTLWLAKETV